MINELPVEKYLRGLGEVSNSAHPEKAKTILTAARTYAYYYMGDLIRKFPGKPYDGSDSPDEFQKYIGYSYELRSPNTVRIVEETEGQIITYKGNIVKPWYHNSSNGLTRSYTDYCDYYGVRGCVDVPFLQSVVDPSPESTAHNAHGVGISGNGADYLAGEGKGYVEILKYFLPDTEVKMFIADS